ncbi:vacuolar protein sorting-associated protein 37A-like isoform X3 [Leguminivora glycinivorella]|uniref:vacuolar protein sorting-associated protein 37A-like isoform X2 n=1 Tax=Leguminivora glycinivorella TaxID=1035111 RepID=UPI00200E946C|nr:vacuolar protein sorting-associated protein 37A-like isoform X2 [Leguminivora glycinivorella]XP_048004082.1 vacuolar protein sorting-associated protein 37A-like isoform X3 [Leguminivora glycinivorella]
MLPRQYYNEQDLRKRQIDTLKIFNDNVQEVTENTEYKVDFTINGRIFSLNVILGPEFPNEKPVILVNPPVSHPWVAEHSSQVVGAPGLIQFTVHSDLGRVVHAVIRELQKAVPVEEEPPQSSPSHAPHSLLFPELGELTIEELHEILENTDLQDKLLETTPQLLALNLETEELMLSIERIARDNIAEQQRLEELKTDVVNRISALFQMKINYEELHTRHQKLSEEYDPHRIRDCLKTAALKADEDAESIAEQFLLGKMPVESFISQFAETRARGQARRAREERLAHQLAQLHRAT